MPWLAAPFRPFYALGAAYAIALMALAGLGYAGIAPRLFPMQWHAHEMVHGFAVAIIAGTALTALPSWSGSDETRGTTLALLAACWLAGRGACFLAPWLPWPWVAAADLLLPLAVVAHLAPRLVRLRERRWLLVVVIFLALALANLAWHAATGSGDGAAATRAQRAALWVVVVMFTLAGGLFTPVFTANVLAERGFGPPRSALPALELAAGAALVALAAADVVGAAPSTLAGLAMAALALQTWRFARWRGWLAWRAAREPLVGGMHLGFAWLLAALALKAAAHLDPRWPEGAWVHAFTAGALGSMMLALMTRVALRHTGRALVAPPALPWWLLLASLAALLRIAAAGLGAWAWAAAAWLFALAFAAWFAVHAPMLWRASLPRRG